MGAFVLYSLILVFGSLSAVAPWHAHRHRRRYWLLWHKELFQQLFHATQHRFGLRLAEQNARWALASSTQNKQKTPSTVWEGPDS
jgi:hypothetical protein